MPDAWIPLREAFDLMGKRRYSKQWIGERGKEYNEATARHRPKPAKMVIDGEVKDMPSDPMRVLDPEGREIGEQPIKPLAEIPDAEVAAAERRDEVLSIMREKMCRAESGISRIGEYAIPAGEWSLESGFWFKPASGLAGWGDRCGKLDIQRAPFAEMLKDIAETKQKRRRNVEKDAKADRKIREVLTCARKLYPNYNPENPAHTIHKMAGKIEKIIATYKFNSIRQILGGYYPKMKELNITSPYAKR